MDDCCSKTKQSFGENIAILPAPVPYIGHDVQNLRGNTLKNRSPQGIRMSFWYAVCDGGRLFRLLHFSTALDIGIEIAIGIAIEWPGFS
jgi:hypothetical protein